MPSSIISLLLFMENFFNIPTCVLYRFVIKFRPYTSHYERGKRRPSIMNVCLVRLVVKMPL